MAYITSEKLNPRAIVETISVFGQQRHNIIVCSKVRKINVEINDKFIEKNNKFEKIYNIVTTRQTLAHVGILLLYINLFFIHNIYFARGIIVRKLNYAAVLFSTKSRVLSRGSREYRDSTVKFYPA